MHLSFFFCTGAVVVVIFLFLSRLMQVNYGFTGQKSRFFGWCFQNLVLLYLCVVVLFVNNPDDDDDDDEIFFWRAEHSIFFLFLLLFVIQQSRERKRSSQWHDLLLNCRRSNYKDDERQGAECSTAVDIYCRTTLMPPYQGESGVIIASDRQVSIYERVQLKSFPCCVCNNDESAAAQRP